MLENLEHEACILIERSSGKVDEKLQRSFPDDRILLVYESVLMALQKHIGICYLLRSSL